MKNITANEAETNKNSKRNSKKIIIPFIAIILIIAITLGIFYLVRNSAVKTTENKDLFFEGTVAVGKKGETKEENYYILVNEQGEAVSSTKFEWIGNMASEGLYSTRLNGKYGYINNLGEWIIEPQFASAEYFSEGIAAVSNEKGLYGFIDKTGNFVIEPKYNDVGIFKNGYINVAIDEKWGLIDKNGNTVIEPQFEYLSEYDPEIKLIYMSTDTCNGGYINLNGEQVIEATYHISQPLTDKIIYLIDHKSKYSLFDASKKEFIIKDYCSLGDDFSSGLIYFGVETDDETKYGYINKEAKTVIEADFYGAEDFSEGLAAVKNKNGLWGFIDKSGDLVIDYKYEDSDHSHQFSNGLCLVEKTEKINDKTVSKYGFINKKGEMVVDYILDSARIFENGFSIVKLDGFNGIINTEGEFVFKEKDVLIEGIYSDGYAVVNKEDKYNILDISSGKFLLDEYCDAIDIFPIGKRHSGYAD